MAPVSNRCICCVQHDIRKMVEETNEELSKELKSLRDQLDAAVAQRQKLQTERNGTQSWFSSTALNR